VVLPIILCFLAHLADFLSSAMFFLLSFSSTHSKV
jgi:hypothetical protein